MLLCNLRGCTCTHHRLLDCIHRGTNDEAMLILRCIENHRDLVDDSGLTLLHYSAINSNAEMAQKLINEGHDVNAQDKSGFTPLMLAVNKAMGGVETVEVLLRNNANIYLVDNNGHSSIYFALIHRMQEHKRSDRAIRLLFDKVNEDYSSKKDWLTNWFINSDELVQLAAVLSGDLQLAKNILDIGYRIDYCEPIKGYTALHCAVIFAKIDLCLMLIEYGANVNAIDKEGNSALYYYTRDFERVDEDSRVLKALLKSRMILSIDRDVEHFLKWGRKETVRTVLQSGIQFDESYLGSYILHLFIENYNNDVMELLDELNIEFDVDKPIASFGFTALAFAAFHGWSRKVEFLLKHGADPNELSSKGTPVLHFAIMLENKTPICERDVAKIVELLLQHGANALFILNDGKYIVDAISQHKETPFAKVIIAHLAMLKARGVSASTDYTLHKIKIHKPHEAHFDSCTGQLEEIKTFDVHEQITLFNLLTASDEQLVAYARNHELMTAFDSVMEGIQNLDSYYVNSLRRRIGIARYNIKLKQNAAMVLGLLGNFCSDAYFNIVNQIMSYLSWKDLRNLCKARGICPTML